MTILSLLHILSFVAFLWLMVYVLYKNPKALLNRVCSLFIFSFTIWSFMEAFQQGSESENAAILWVNIASIGWISFAVLATSYLNATGKVLNLSSSASIERLFFDNRANVLKEAVKESAMAEHILVIVTEFIVRDTNIKGKILLLPDIDSLKVIFKQAGAFK